MSNTDYSATRMAEVQNHLATVFDLETGNVGERFFARYKETGCAAHIGLKNDENWCGATFTPFSYLKPEGAFVNRFDYIGLAGEVPAYLTLSFIHEATHAMQWDRAPILHAAPYNTHTPVIVSPLDWLVIMRVTEQDAAVKRAWIASLLGESDPGAAIADAGKPFTGEEFAELRRACGSLSETFNRAVAQSLEKEHSKEFNGNKQSFADYYNGYALMTYDNNRINRTYPNGPALPAIIRMEDEDFRQIGKTFGFDILEGRSIAELRETVKATLSPAHRALLENLNQALGIDDENALPTFREKLREYGYSPYTFLHTSKTNGLKPA